MSRSPATLFDEQESKYLGELWFLMHHSDSPDRECVVLTCYVDDSGTHEQSETVVLGGLFMDRDNFVRFDTRWRSMLQRYAIQSLHMNEFVRPHGRHIGMWPEMKIALFTEAVEIINARKSMSVTVALNHKEFKAAIPINVYREMFSPYVAAFLHLARLSAESAQRNDAPDRISYLIDQGCAAADQIRLGHAIEQGWENAHWPLLRTGALAFDSDENVSALQAADAVAWSYQRRLANKLTEEFIPLNEIFRERFNAHNKPVRSHWHIPVKDDNPARVIEMVNTVGPRVMKQALENLKRLEQEGGVEAVKRYAQGLLE